MKRFVQKTGEVAALLAAATAGTIGLERLLALEFVDLRYQQIFFYSAEMKRYAASFFFLLLILVIGTLRLKRQMTDGCAAKEIVKCSFPLLLCVPFAFVVPTFLTINLIIFSIAWAAGRWFGIVAEADGTGGLNRKKVFSIVSAAAVALAIGGGCVQWWSFSKMAMQWLDWGHFYESLVNTLDGRFFYLNLGDGCYLGSRFCISLLSLLPVVIFREPVLFLFAGAFLVASGAVLVAVLAKVVKLPELDQLRCGIWFCALPLTLNMLLVLLDGFHETFLAIPAVLGAWCCYRAGKWKWVLLLVVFCIGIRETLGFMLAGFGLVLIFEKRLKTGAVLLLCALLYLVLMLGVVMPAIARGGHYDHVVFFPHLGNSIGEIAASPFCKAEVFWGTLFSKHNLAYWVTLFLPFVFGLAKPVYLLAMIPDLLMVSLDNRFDSQNILRHYQTVPFLVMTITFVESMAYLRANPNGRAAKIWRAFFGSKVDLSNAVMGSALCAVVLMSWCYTQIPGFPASDKRLFQWSYAGETMDRFFAVMDKGNAVSASPRIASWLVGRNDVHIVTGDMNKKVQDYCFIESFGTEYNEYLLRRKLLADKNYVLIHSEYLDERLIQLFERRQPGKRYPSPTPAVFMISEAEWLRFGTPMSSAIGELELRSRPGAKGKSVLLAARLRAPVKFDIGFRVSIKYRGENNMVEMFTSFGNGTVPADVAGAGKVFVFEIPFDGIPEKCKISLVKLP